MTKTLLSFIALCLISVSLRGQIVYTPQDSVRIEQLLQQPIEGDTVLFYARQFLGTPYVAHTLEVADPEQLVVNTLELDCTTLVETVLALAKTRAEGKQTFADYCTNLENFRYFGGRRDGYLSRLHYFSWWKQDNLQRGNIVEVRNARYFTSPLMVKNSYMSTKPQLYKMLRRHPEWVSVIRKLEQAYNGEDGTYLPKRFVNQDASQLSPIADGDLIAIVTSKAGLDYSHLGFAVWGRDGKLHLLNASSIHHKVIEEPMTLYQYLSKSTSRLGIRCFRLQ